MDWRKSINGKFMSINNYMIYWLYDTIAILTELSKSENQHFASQLNVAKNYCNMAAGLKSAAKSNSNVNADTTSTLSTAKSLDNVGKRGKVIVANNKSNLTTAKSIGSKIKPFNKINK